MIEVSLDEVRGVIRPRPDYAHIRDERAKAFRESELRQNALLDSLPSNGRWALVLMDLG